MGMNSAPGPERPLLSKAEEMKIRDKIEELKNAEQAAINRANAFREGAGDEEYKNPKIEMEERQQMAFRQEIDNLERRLTGSQLEG